MTKEVVSFGGGAGLPANPDALLKGLQNVGQTLQGGMGGVPLLRLLKSGVFAYGPENIEPEEDSLWAMNPNSLQHGWACWEDSELIGEQMVPFTSPAPARGELPTLGADWKQQVSMVLQCMNGEDEGISVLYKGTSIGLINAVKELINSIVRQLQSDATHCVPVLALECDSYQHKKHGEIFFPVLEIRKWVAFDGSQQASGAIENKNSEAPRATAAAPAPAAAAAPAPQGRNRRSAGNGSQPQAQEAPPQQQAPATAAAVEPRSRRRRRGG